MKIADMAKSTAEMQEVLKKLVPEAVFQLGIAMMDSLQFLRLQKIMM